jgi:hypothetical protein
MSCTSRARPGLHRRCAVAPRPTEPIFSEEPEEEAAVNSWYLWTAPVRNLTWVAARFGHR